MATRTQERIAEALADPKIPTMTAVAKAAGVSRMTAYRARQNVTVQSKALEIEEKRLRRSRGYRALGDTLIRGGVDSAAELDAMGKITAGAGLVKLGHEVDDSPLGGTPADIDAYSKSLRKAALIGARAYARGRFPRALRLLGAPQDVVVEAVSRVQMRLRNRTIQAEVVAIQCDAPEK